MQWLKTVFAYQKRLYCSKAWQRIMPGGSRDKEGKKLFSIGKWGDAEEYYDLLLAKYPNRVLFLERAAFVKQTRGNIVAAESILSDLVSLYPEVPRFTIRLSNILLEKKRSQEAINILARALLYSPKSIKLMIFLIKASSLLENWDKEKDVFLRCLEKSRNNKSLLIDYLARCRENNDIEAIKAVKHCSAIKDYFLNDHCLNEKTKEKIFGGFPHFSNEYFSKIQIHPGLQLARRSVRMADYENEYVAVKNGIRRTVGVPPTYDKTIYLIGASRLYGSYCEDSHTIASYLQSLFNSCPGENVRVMNLGVDGQRHHNAFLCIMAEQPRKGDIVLFFPPPNVYHSQFQTDAFNEDFRYYRAMREFCARAGAFFHIVFFPSSFTVANPTGREQLMQTIMLHGENPAATITEIKKNIDKYYAQLHEEDFQCLRLTDIFDRPHTLGEIFFDATHFSHRANKMIAQRLFDHLQQSVRITGSRVTDEEIQEIQDHAKRNLRQVTIKHHFSDEMERFLKEVKNSNFGGGSIGAIVMNCNPFTLGHRHLIETAAKMVDGLYIFVVQEDRSFFPFADRLFLVQQGVKDVEGRIHVVPSGKFIISNFSFAGYFAKTRTIEPADSTVDVAIFGSIIAPALGIAHRFVGEEPNCLTTNEYNETMKFLLPSFGVQMHVIPRKAESGKPISATTVRDCLQIRDFETISKLVPKTTLEYLKNFPL